MHIGCSNHAVICNGYSVRNNPGVQIEVKAPDDKAYFSELAAIFTLRILLLSCQSRLELCAYQHQDASPVLSAKLQSTPIAPYREHVNACPVDLSTKVLVKQYRTAHIQQMRGI